jgi:hypothetical protein
MDNINSLQSRGEISGRRPKCNITAVTVVIEMQDLFGHGDSIHARTDAAQGARLSVQEMVTLDPKEIPRITAAASKTLLDMISQKYELP